MLIEKAVSKVEGIYTSLSFSSGGLHSGSGKISAIAENRSAPAKNCKARMKNIRNGTNALQNILLKTLTQRLPFRKPIALTAS